MAAVERSFTGKVALVTGGSKGVGYWPGLSTILLRTHSRTPEGSQISKIVPTLAEHLWTD